MSPDDQSSSGDEAGPFVVPVGSALDKRMAEMTNQGPATTKGFREQLQATKEVNQKLRDGWKDFADRLERIEKNKRKIEARMIGDEATIKPMGHWIEGKDAVLEEKDDLPEGKDAVLKQQQQETMLELERELEQRR
jgi:hypothetical protein